VSAWERVHFRMSVFFVEFKRCTKPAQVPHRLGPAWGMDIIYVDTPSAEAAENLALIICPFFLEGHIPMVSRLLWLPARIT
jgi:hypothetical protein